MDNLHHDLDLIGEKGVYRKYVKENLWAEFYDDVHFGEEFKAAITLRLDKLKKKFESA